MTKEEAAKHREALAVKVLAMRDQGKSGGEIAKALSISQPTASKIIRDARGPQRAKPREHSTKGLPADVVAKLNADILEGKMTEDELRAKYGIGRVTVYRFKRKLRTGMAAVPEARRDGANGTPGDPDKVDQSLVRRTVAFVGRLAEKYPHLLLELDIPQRVLKKHSALIMELI